VSTPNNRYVDAVSVLDLARHASADAEHHGRSLAIDVARYAAVALAIVVLPADATHQQIAQAVWSAFLQSSIDCRDANLAVVAAANQREAAATEAVNAIVAEIRADEASK